MMKRINSSVALAVVLLLPALSWTQDKGDGAAGQTIKIAQANPSAAVKVSQRQMKQAHATFLADREAAKLMSAGGKSLVEEEDAPGLGFLNQAGVVAAVVPLFVSDAWLAPGGTIIL